MINVTKTFLPPKQEYLQWLDRIWNSGQITNAGAVVAELEKGLKRYFETPHFWFVANGTMALQLAIHALELEGEILTTPFSYVATTSSILWQKCTPKFVDIESNYLCMNPALIEQMITPRTTAILAVHVYGNPCDVEAICTIGQRHGLRVIFDCAHAFGVRYKNRPLPLYGDVSAMSFHATKLFHTVEGGGLVCRDEALARKLFLSRSFGHIRDEHYSLGINAKNSEFHAAMGLAILPYVPEIITTMRSLTDLYDRLLIDFPMKKPSIRESTDYNYAYYPLIFESESQLLEIKACLERDQIHPRRYFYPSLNRLSYLSADECPVSEDIAKRILCLPLYPGLAEESVNRICTSIKSVL